MPIDHLLKSQSNEVYLSLVEAGWDVAGFEWSLLPSRQWKNTRSPALIHKQSEFYYLFDQRNGSFFYYCSPGREANVQGANLGSWNDQLVFFQDWLRFLGREVNAPDLWVELPMESKLIESASEEENSKFTKEEKKILVEGIAEIKEYLLATHHLDAQLVEAQLKYLVESAERLGRKDWKGILISTIFSIIVQGGVAGHSAQEIFQFVWTVLNAVLIQKLYLP